MKKDNPKILAWIHILEKQKEREQKRFNQLVKQLIVTQILLLLIFWIF
tara:strand:- start:718 stop:861 length:144 start_codon:yes stop_codon:yes gene_type:complete